MLQVAMSSLHDVVGLCSSPPQSGPAVCRCQGGHRSSRHGAAEEGVCVCRPAPVTLSPDIMPDIVPLCNCLLALQNGCVFFPFHPVCIASPQPLLCQQSGSEAALVALARHFGPTLFTALPQLWSQVTQCLEHSPALQTADGGYACYSLSPAYWQQE